MINIGQSQDRRGIAQILNNRVMCMLLVIVTGASFFFSSAYADANSPIVLTANIVTASDGQQPPIDIDPVVQDNDESTDDVNGLVANMDQVTENFNFTMNTTDGLTHNLDYVIINANFVSGANGSFDENAISPTCLPVTGSTRVKNNGLNISCKMMGPFPIGNAVQVNVGWFPPTKTANNSDISVQYNLSGVMKADGQFPTPINPDAVTSNIVTTKAVSTTSGVDMMKKAGAPTYNRDANGAIESVTLDWGITFGLTNPSAGASKGMNPSALGKITAEDNLKSMGAPWQNARVEACGTGVNGDSHPVIMGNASNTGGHRGWVKNAGTFTCTQSGPGENVLIENTGVDFDTNFFPFGYSNATPQEYYGLNQSGRPREVYKQTPTTNYHAVVSGGWMTTTIPYADIVAYDNSAADTDTRRGFVNICNVVSDLNVEGSDPTSTDMLSDNKDCVKLEFGLGEGYTKQFTLGTRRLGYIDQLLKSNATAFGAKNGRDNIVISGEKIFTTLSLEAPKNLNAPLQNAGFCDAIDNNNLVLTNSSFYKDIQAIPGIYNTGEMEKFLIKDYSIVHFSDTGASNVFTPPQDSDVEVLFASVAPMTTSDALTNVNCDDAAINWVSDPNTVAGGITKANLIKAVLKPGKILPPGYNLEISIPMQVLANKQPGELVQNAAQYRGGSGSFAHPTTCNLYDWNLANGSSLCDRALVIPPTGHLEITDSTDATAAGTEHRTSETTKIVESGKDHTFDIRAEATYNGDINIKDVNIYTIIPEGMRYKSATISPSKIINDCDASINFGCIADATLRTNAGATTLVWNRGDFDFKVPSGHTITTPYTSPDLFGFIKLTLSTDKTLTSSTLLQVRAWLESSSGMTAGSGTTTFPNIPAWGGYYDNASNGQFDDDWVTFSSPRAFSISKSVHNELVPINGTGYYDIAFANTSPDTQKFDFIDVLPYNGDNRVPRVSKFTGGYALSEIIKTKATSIDKIYITSKTPGEIDKDPSKTSNVLNDASSIWTCTYDQAGVGACPTTDKITAIRITTTNIAPDTRQVLRIGLKLSDKIGGGFYANQASGNPSKINNTLIWSENVFFRTPYYGVGDLVFNDKNDDGKFDVADGDVGIKNVSVELLSAGPDGVMYNSDDLLIDTDVTDNDGRYLMHANVAGDYYVRIAHDQLVNKGALSDFLLQKDGVDDPNNDKDESVDHNGFLDDSLGTSANFVRSNSFNLSNEDEPLGEANSTPDRDMSENLTIDFGFVAKELPPEVTTTTTTLPISTTTTIPTEVKGNVITNAIGGLPFTGSSTALADFATIILGLGLVSFLVAKKRRELL